MTDIGPGDLVVCVDDSQGSDPVITYPVRGMIYTVRELDHTPGDPAIYLCEIVNPLRHYLQGYCEAAFLLRRFRPIRKPSIEILRKAVDDVPAEVCE